MSEVPKRSNENPIRSKRVFHLLFEYSSYIIAQLDLLFISYDSQVLAVGYRMCIMKICFLFLSSCQKMRFPIIYHASVAIADAARSVRRRRASRAGAIQDLAEPASLDCPASSQDLRRAKASVGLSYLTVTRIREICFNGFYIFVSIFSMKYTQLVYKNRSEKNNFHIANKS